MSTTLEPMIADPPPQLRTVLCQPWTELAYFHRPYVPEAIQQLLPRRVTVDTFEGNARVELIPFAMRKDQLGPTPQYRAVLSRRTWSRPVAPGPLKPRRGPGLDSWLFTQAELIGAEVSVDPVLDQAVIDGRVREQVCRNLVER